MKREIYIPAMAAGRFLADLALDLIERPVTLAGRTESI